MDTVLDRPRTNPIELFTTWLLVGIQSFGGGSSTFSLIHQVVIQRGWLSEEEFVRAWALAQIAPGINLVKLTVMLGYRLNGWIGVLATTSGLLLPSALVTVLMTVGFATVRNLPWVQAMMKGIIPAAIGLSLAMGANMAQPVLTRAHKEGAVRLGAHLLILAAAALLMGIAKLSPVAILLLSGVAAIVLLALVPVPQSKQSIEKDAR